MTATTTIRWYEANAASYFDATVGIDAEATRARFAAALPGGARVLDAGCGSGRDALAFRRAGFDVQGIDATPALAAMAAEHAGVPVRVLRFEDLEDEAKYDGIWAMGSLLHVPAAEIPAVLAKLRRALVPGGLLFCCFKDGTGERTDADGRTFVDLTGPQLDDALCAAGLVPFDVWPCVAGRAGAQALWHNALARRPEEAAEDLGAEGLACRAA